MNHLVRNFMAVMVLAGVLGEGVSACTDVRVQAKDGTVVVARSMEFAVLFHSNMRSSPRGREFQNTAPDGKPGLKWKSKYGYIYLDGLQVDVVCDGMNEKGLSFEYLYLPGETQYQDVPAGREDRAMPQTSLGAWILGNFSTVDEVRDAMKDVYVFGQKVVGVVMPLHAVIHTPDGKGIVIEFVGGKVHVYDNPLGVVTNSPTYDWHMVNMRNYVNLSAYNPSPVKVEGVSFLATGQGAGLHGLPGDWTPPSRFVRTAFGVHLAMQPTDAMSAINLGEHLMNDVDIPLGIVRSEQENKMSNELTQWVVFKDLTHRKLYYRTYRNMTLREIDMDKINLAEGGPLLVMPIGDEPQVMDMTESLLKSSASPVVEKK